MFRRVAAFWLSWVLVFGCVVIIVEIAEPVMGATTIYVDDSGGANYTKIQEGIDAASDGDTVFVYSGIYYENVVVDRTINLTGENMDATIINGGVNGDVVHINANWTNVTGFTITESGGDINDAGIELNNVHNCSIIWNNISNNNAYGIYLESSANIKIINNNVSNQVWRGGIYLDKSSHNDIIDNYIPSNIRGIYLISSFFNNITHNIITLTADEGLLLSYSDNNNITGNNITFNDYGIIVFFSSFNAINGNTVWNNDEGIIIYSSQDNSITNNAISFNNWFGIYLVLSINILITNNNLTNDGIRITGNHLYKSYILFKKCR
jgi:parallel beta-helix repeat protein